METKRTKPNSRELHTIEFIAGLDMRLNAGERYLEERLRSVPDLWRQFRIAKKATEKTLDGLYDTLDLGSLLHINTVNKNSEIVIRPRSVLNNSNDAQVVLTKDIKTLVKNSMDSSCRFCLKTGSEIKHCELRKALMNVAPLTEIKNGDLCGYAYECNTEL